MRPEDEREEVTSATRNVRLSEETETLQEVADIRFDSSKHGSRNSQEGGKGRLMHEDSRK